MNLRGKRCIGIILHLGAKVRDLPRGGMGLDDPGGLLFERIVRQWIAHV